MLDLTKGFVLRSAVIGLLAGSVLGGLFGVTYFVSIWTSLVGAGLGVGLGLTNGLLIGVITGLFFYPLHHGQRYRVTVTAMSAFIAWAGAIAFGPWYFSSTTAITPSSAVLIGFGSVLASIVAGWAGGLLGQNLADWYNHRLIAERASGAVDPATLNTTPLKPKRYLDNIFLSQRSGWIKVALFAVLCPRLGNALLKFLVCGDLNADVFSCLPSPRLYTSVWAGLRVSLPIFLLTVLAIALFQSRSRAR